MEALLSQVKIWRISPVFSVVFSRRVCYTVAYSKGPFGGVEVYDEVESLVFSQCLAHGMAPLTELYQGQLIPSQAFAEGGIHEAIMAYEDTTFFEILAQELALRDMDDPPITEENYDEVMNRMNAYLGEFEAHGTDHISVDME